MNILIKNCNLISMKSNSKQIDYNTDIFITDGKIKKIGKNLIEKKCQIINAKDKYVTPGLINCHTHIPMQLHKEITDGLKLYEWLTQKI